MLCSVEDVKRKLEVPVSDEALDETLEPVAVSASERVLSLTGYVAADESRVDVLRRVRAGVELLLPKRPVAELTKVEGRLHGDTSWETLTGDLIDGDEGVFVVVTGDVWPPTRTQGPSNRVWPVVRVTYDVDGSGMEDDARRALRDAAAALAAYWYTQHIAGAGIERAVGPIRQRLSEAAEPSWLYAMLGGRVRAGGGAWLV